MSLPSSTALHTDTNELESGWLCGPVFPKPISFRVTHGGDRSLAQRCARGPISTTYDVAVEPSRAASTSSTSAALNFLRTLPRQRKGGTTFAEVDDKRGGGGFFYSATHRPDRGRPASAGRSSPVWPMRWGVAKPAPARAYHPPLRRLSRLCAASAKFFFTLLRPKMLLVDAARDRSTATS